jgi:hypothetical protein
MPLPSPRFVVLPAAALAIIIALAQAHSPAGARSTEAAAAVHRVTNCAVPSKTLVATCVVADSAGASVMR